LYSIPPNLMKKGKPKTRKQTLQSRGDFVF